MYLNSVMYPRARPAAHSLRLLAAVGRAALTLLGAVLVGFGIPALWLKIGGAIEPDTGEGTLAAASLAVVLGGIVASYLAVIMGAGLVAGRRQAAAPRHHNWNRSMRDERHRPPTLNALETLFVVTTLLVGVAYLVWFFVAAPASGPPLG
jgi:uncharacterized membrane protein YjgN (DUF898 family)